jgi:hypothetical protein
LQSPAHRFSCCIAGRYRHPFPRVTARKGCASGPAFSARVSNGLMGLRETMFAKGKSELHKIYTKIKLDIFQAND